MSAGSWAVHRPVEDVGGLGVANGIFTPGTVKAAGVGIVAGEYLVSDLNSFAGLARRRVPVGTLRQASGGPAGAHRPVSGGARAGRDPPRAARRSSLAGAPGLLAAGLTNPEIAERLVLSPYTVQDHIKSLFEKTSVSSRQERVARIFLDDYLPRIDAGHRSTPPAGSPSAEFVSARGARAPSRGEEAGRIAPRTSEEETRSVSRRVYRLLLCGVLTLAATAALSPGAQASVAPTITLDQSAGTAAGSSTNLGVDLKFSPSAGDSPKQLTLNLPPGLLANASINGGACLATADLSDSACEVSSGVVTANLLGTIPVPAPVIFDLVPPPAPGDLAGLAVNSNGTQIGTTGDITVRPSGDPAGVGVTISLTLPNSLSGTPISITEINSTFAALRYPTTCPATPHSLSATVDSYNDQTLQTVAAPLSVTGCSALPYAPAFSVAVTRDRADRQVALSTTVTQGPAESPSQSVSLAFPSATLLPNLQVAGALCVNPASGTCTPVGSATASSPLYPRALTGQAYLTGSILGPALTLVFPPPFPLTLSGAVNLTKNTTTFTGLPDIPLTNLTVSLDPGPEAVFGTTCKPPTNTATATLTNQNGDRTVTVPGKFTVSGCPASGGSGGNGNPGGAHGTHGKPKVSNAFIAGLGSGHPSLGFRISAAKGSPRLRLRKVTIVLPSGLGVITHRIGTRIVVRGVSASGARGASLSLSNGHLVITLRTAAASLLVKLDSGALDESSALKRRARAHHPPRLFLSLITTNAAGKRTAVRVPLG